MPKRPRQKTQARTRAGRSVDTRLGRQRPARRAPAAKRADRPGPFWQGLAKGVGWALLFVAVGAGLVAGYGLLSLSPAFAVRRAEVLGTDHLSRMEVLSAAGVGLHTSLLALSPAKVERRLAALGWVEAADVRRLWPRGVEIRVTERRPVALALVEGRLFYLDRAMEPFAPVGGQAPPDLVVLSGLRKADLLEPDEEVAGLLARAGELLRGLPTLYTASGGRLSEVHLDRVWGLSLVFNDMGAVVRLGHERLTRRLVELARVRADLERRGELAKAVLIDLTDDRRVVVRLAEGARA